MSRDDESDELMHEERDAEAEQQTAADTNEELASAILDEPQVDVTQLYLNEIGQAPLLTAAVSHYETDLLTTSLRAVLPIGKALRLAGGGGRGRFLDAPKALPVAAGLARRPPPHHPRGRCPPGTRERVGARPVLEMLTATLLACPPYQNYGRQIAQRQFQPAGFRLVLGLKDIELAMSAARSVSVPMPLAGLLRDRALASVNKGRGDWEWSAFTLEAAEAAGVGEIVARD